MNSEFIRHFVINLRHTENIQYDELVCFVSMNCYFVFVLLSLQNDKKKECFLKHVSIDFQMIERYQIFARILQLIQNAADYLLTNLKCSLNPNLRKTFFKLWLILYWKFLNDFLQCVDITILFSIWLILDDMKGQFHRCFTKTATLFQHLNVLKCH